MAAIWHDSGIPSWIGAGPQFSFFDIAQIVQPAPESYQQARVRMQMIERRLGAVFYQHNAELAHSWYMRKREWWVI